LNRFLRESVKQKLGPDFLLTHAVSDIPSGEMRIIKKEAFEKYLPQDRRPIKSWSLAMASLRCLKRDLVKNKQKQLAKLAEQEEKLKDHHHHQQQQQNDDQSRLENEISSSPPSSSSPQNEIINLNNSTAMITETVVTTSTSTQQTNSILPSTQTV
jgi:hypothetical protein